MRAGNEQHLVISVRARKAGREGIQERAFISDIETTNLVPVLMGNEKCHVPVLEHVF